VEELPGGDLGERAEFDQLASLLRRHSRHGKRRVGEEDSVDAGAPRRLGGLRHLPGLGRAGGRELGSEPSGGDAAREPGVTASARLAERALAVAGAHQPHYLRALTLTNVAAAAGMKARRGG
jgi:hypothetical protein